MEIKYIQNKITELRIKRGLSAYELSYQLGHSKNYIHNIVSGYSQTTVNELLYIIDFFGMTPRDFFDEEYEYADPVLGKNIIDAMRGMSKENLVSLAHLVNLVRGIEA